MVKPKSTAKTDIATMRRERVASLLARGLTQREIQDRLAKGGEKILNPDSQLPYDLATINRDIKRLRVESQTRASASIDEHRARQLAEILEIKRAAWEGGDPELALKALDREIKLLGTLRQLDGVTININIELVNEVYQVLREAGADPEQVFRELREAALARKRVGPDGAEPGA